MKLGDLSDDALVTQMAAACRAERRLVADIVAYLVEVEDRRLDLRSGCSSLFDYCVRALEMSEGAAFRRINAARLVRRFPCLLAKLASGDLHLSGLVLLRDYFTNDNVEELAEAASHRSESKLRKLIARRWPRSAVPDRIDKLRRTRVEPLSAEEYFVQFTMSASMHEKLERARDLLRHSYPDGDIASVLERALDLLIPKLERERRGAAKRPRTRPSPDSTSETSRATQREVFARDREQCTYRSETGERCPARGLLEIDHVEARALGGSSDPSNLRILCGPHNRLHAEDDFGKQYVAEKVERRRKKSMDAVAHAAGVEVARPPVVDDFDDYFRQRKSVESEASTPSITKDAPEGAPTPSVAEAASVHAPPPPAEEAATDEARAIYGLVDLGFARDKSERTVKSILTRRGGRAPLGDVLREAIDVLAAST